MRLTSPSQSKDLARAAGDGFTSGLLRRSTRAHALAHKSTRFSPISRHRLSKILNDAKYVHLHFEAQVLSLARNARRTTSQKSLARALFDRGDRRAERVVAPHARPAVTETEKAAAARGE